MLFCLIYLWAPACTITSSLPPQPASSASFNFWSITLDNSPFTPCPLQLPSHLFTPHTEQLLDIIICTPCFHFLTSFLSLIDSKASVAKAKLMETFCASDTDDHSFLLPLWGSLVPLLPPKSLLPGCLCWLLLLSWNLNASVYQDSELFLSSFFAQMVLSWKPTAVGSTYRPTTLHILPSCDISPEPQTLPDFLPAISIGDSLAKLCPTLCNPMDCSRPGFPDLRSLLEFAQIHEYLIGISELTYPLWDAWFLCFPHFFLFQEVIPPPYQCTGNSLDLILDFSTSFIQYIHCINKTLCLNYVSDLPAPLHLCC